MKKLTLLLILYSLLGACKKQDNLEKMLPCLDYRIMYSKKIENNEIYIEFNKTKSPEVCLTALEPATCYIGLDNINEGEYDIIYYTIQVE